MDESFLKPKITPYSSPKGYLKHQKIYILAALILFIFGTGWLLVKRFSASPLDKVENLIKNKNLKKAAVLNYEMMNEHPENRLAYLMNGAIINFGLREMNITDTKLPFYEYEDFLVKEDRTGVFLRQSFLRKYSLFPESVYFMHDFCGYYSMYPESTANPETMIVIQRALQNQTHWTAVPKGCMDILFSDTPQLSSFFGTVNGDNLSVREKPQTKAKVLTKLKKKDRVLIKFEALEETIGDKKGKWIYVLTQDSVYGWVFGGYIER